MSGEIKRGGMWERPTWAYGNRSPKYWDEIHAQLLESIRNVLEDIKRSQMLQCDVRGDIGRIRMALERKKRKARRRK